MKRKLLKRRVSTSVPTQASLIPKHLLTSITLMENPLSVNCRVLPQRVGPLKSLIAHLTLVRAIARMNPHVHLHFMISNKTFIAILTNVLSFQRVYAIHVLVHVPLTPEPLLTHLTLDVIILMATHVDIEGNACFRPIIALVTHEFPFARMQSVVHFEVLSGAVTVSAYFATVIFYR